MFSKQAVATSLVAALLASATACSTKSSATTVAYHVTGPATLGTVSYQYINSDGDRTDASTPPGTIDWTMEATTTADEVFVMASVANTNADPKLNLTCTISVGGKVVATNVGWITCEATAKLKK